MTGIDTNVIGSSSSSLLVLGVSRLSRTNQAERALRVTLPGSEQPPDTTPIATNSVRIRSINQNIRMLFSRDTPFVGEMTLADSAFAVAIKSNGGLSKNSYFSISGSVSDQVALSFGQGSSTQVRHDPKVLGRSARGG